jgi:hypothetical protein
MVVTVNSTVVWNVMCLVEFWARGDSRFLHDVSDFLPNDRASHFKCGDALSFEVFADFKKIKK